MMLVLTRYTLAVAIIHHQHPHAQFQLQDSCFVLNTGNAICIRNHDVHSVEGGEEREKKRRKRSSYVKYHDKRKTEIDTKDDERWCVVS
jgi:hypothetical protein